MEDRIEAASRVYQIEAHKLDNEFNKIVDQFVDGLDLPKVGEEAKLLIKLYVLGNHLKQGTTIGKDVYNIKYKTVAQHQADQFRPPKNYQLMLIVASNLILPYVTKRLEKIRDIIDHACVSKLNISWLTLDNVGMTLKLLNVINFLVFLRSGKYLHIEEAILGLLPTMTSQSYHDNFAANAYQMEVIHRNRMWSALTEFLILTIPFINFTKIKNQCLRPLHYVFGSYDRQSSSNKKQSSMIELTRCAICRKSPFNPYIIGCKHTFCYYCIQSRYLADPSVGYTCTTCNYSTRDKTQVQRFRAKLYSRSQIG